MNKKNKGFTLVELLAVIVILAIIMIIAVPAVLSVLNTAKKKTFSDFGLKIVNEATKKYLADDLLGNVNNACIIYDIKNDLDLSNTGDYEGFILLKKIGDGKIEHYITFWDKDYLISAVKVDNDFGVDDLIDYTDEDEVLTKGNLAYKAGCKSFTQTNNETKQKETIITADIYTPTYSADEYNFNDSTNYVVGSVSKTTGETNTNTGYAYTKDLVKTNTNNYLLEKLTQTSQTDYGVTIFQYDKDKKYIGYLDYTNGTKGQISVTLDNNTKFIRVQMAYRWQNGQTAIKYMSERRIEIQLHSIKYMSSEKFNSAKNITEYDFTDSSKLLGGCYCSYGYCHNSSHAIYDDALKVEPGSKYKAKVNKNPGGYTMYLVQLDINHNFIQITPSSLLTSAGVEYELTDKTEYVIPVIFNSWYSSTTTFDLILTKIPGARLRFEKM